MLRTLNDLLMGRVAELEDTAEELRLAREQLHEQRTLARHAYRRGYGTGYHTGRAGRPADTHPERKARGRLGQLIRPTLHEKAGMA